SYRFVNTYRSLNQTDEIVVFSKEKWPFYNRVLLPDYVNKTKKWEDLIKYNEQELKDLNITLHTDKGIDLIDKEHKTVKDASGVYHTYDLLILATGSRAFIPPNARMDLPGLFTMRNKKNADDLMKKVSAGSQVVVVGGGLLGLELAAALVEVNVSVSVVQRSSRLMERQLDPVGSAMLREYVEELGIRIFSDDEVTNIRQENDRLQVILHSSRVLSAHALVYAIGTRPNTRLASEAGLKCALGVVVNERLQTSDPSVFALGEIAEYNKKLNGITAAAEQQADVCARYLAGDATSAYSGSVSMNILKFPSLDLCSIGIPAIPNGGKNYNEITFMDRDALYYKKCIIHEDRLVGAILLGDKAEFAEFKELIESKTELSEKRLQLLR
ncbi:MAG: FAD-dependent oxidoreductase, partial [Cytophagales bacterium]|nr:FAD-dependent oxidoreductase [Cytophagales bacterium]